MNRPLSTVDEVDLLQRMFDAAVQAAMPARCIEAHLPELPRGRTVVVGAGKASAAMAAAFEALWPVPLTGLVVTRHGHAVPTRSIEVVEAAHPVPDEAGERAALRMLELVRGLTADDLVVCLISGGGSALLAAPAPGLTLAHKQAMNRALLQSGATIAEMNCVRKHLSRIKGGRLAVACAPARVVTLTISDVPGDDPSVIASGPTVADPSTCAQALAIVRHYGITGPREAIAHLERATDETPKPDDPRLQGHETRLIATPQMSLEAAARVARDAGLTPMILGNALEGEARHMGLLHAGIARQVAGYGQPVGAPCVLLSGGEATVTLRNAAGRGGRCVEFLLALAVALQGRPGVWALAADTDGIDGSEQTAGAWLTPQSWQRAIDLGLDAAAHLSGNDAWSWFAGLEQLVDTGPTLTNVNDFRVILIRAAGADPRA